MGGYDMASRYDDFDSRYTDMGRTRVVTRPSDDEGRPGIGYTVPIEPEGKEGLFDGISVVQIIAGAAAAATSVALASKIGVAGSVIGAAVSSVVTVVSSQLYRRFLSAGARQIRRGREVLSQSASPDPAPSGDAGDGATRPMGAQGAGRGARVAPAKLQARAAAERAATQRKVALFSALAAVAAVVICALAILLGTAGQGLGEKAPSIFPAAEEQGRVQDDSEAASEPTRHTDAGTSEKTQGQGAGETGQQSAGTSTEDSGTGASGQDAAGGTAQTQPSTGSDGGSQQSGSTGSTGATGTDDATSSGSDAGTGTGTDASGSGDSQTGSGSAQAGGTSGAPSTGSVAPTAPSSVG